MRWRRLVLLGSAFIFVSGLLLYLCLKNSLIFRPGTVVSNIKKSSYYQNLLNKPVSPSQLSFSPLSLESIFSQNHQRPSPLPAEKKWTIIATGDVMLGRSINYQSTQQKDFTWVFGKTAEQLASADLTIINLETPLVDYCQPTNAGMKFCADPKNIAGLKMAGVDLASLANNHTANYGVDGLRSTVKLLNEASISALGVSEPVVKDVRGKIITFLGYDDTKANSYVTLAQDKKIQKDISLVKPKSDLVIVSFHWGEEYTPRPTPRQQDLAHLAIDSGADIVIGHHPHWIQPIEIYQEKPIIYSHGNFIFDQNWSIKTRQGLVSRFTFYENQLVDVELLPVEMNTDGQPAWLEGEQKSAILNEIKQESLKLVK